MNKERLDEIKDSINFQYELIVSKGIDKSALLFTDEEQELLKEVERLNKKLELISTLVEREFPPNEFITYRMKKILRGVDKE